ncbi:MAG TPA: hypothetical protein VGE52_19340, partial [Pirellulales bacterium]
MPGVRTIRAALSAVRFVAALLACSAAVWAQPTFPGVPPGVQPEALPAPLGTQPSPGPLPPGAQVPGGAPGAPEDVTAKEQKVADVRVEGRQSVQMAKIQPYIRVRPGRAFNLEMIEADVRSLLATRLFVD